MTPWADALDAAGSLVEWRREDDAAFGVFEPQSGAEGKATLLGSQAPHWSLELHGLSTGELCAVLLALRHPEGGAR